jgi:hypothetical protein
MLSHQDLTETTLLELKELLGTVVVVTEGTDHDT